MYITKKHLSRRTILRGMGVSLALPLLDSMVPAQTPISKTAAAPRSRLACIEMVHGAAGSTVDGSNKHYWSPAKEGSNFEFSQTLKPLEPFRDYVTIVSQTDLNPAGAWAAAEEGGDHFRSSAAFLSAGHAKMTISIAEPRSISCTPSSLARIRHCRPFSFASRTWMDRVHAITDTPAFIPTLFRGLPQPRRCP
jgi:hypothetical protein